MMIESGNRNSSREIGSQKPLSLEERKEQNLTVAAQCYVIARQNILYVRKKSLKDGAINFDALPRDRTFFASHRDLDLRPLATSLFGPYVGENLKRLQDVINGKKILVFGGGMSLSDITSSSDFSPACLINVDPLLPQENLHQRKAGRGYYKSLPIDPTQESFRTELKAEGYDTFDEIWSTFSVPYYCKTRQQVETVFDNGYQSLGADSTFRVFPLGFRLEPMDPVQTDHRLAMLLAGLTSALELLAVKNDIKLAAMRDYSYDESRIASALLIHKIAKVEGFD